MPFSRPDLPTLIDRVALDVEGSLEGADAHLRRNVVAVLARAQAGLAHGQYGYLDFLARQLMPDTAESSWLRRWAAVWGLEPKAAAPAAGNAVLTGVDGTVVTAGAFLQRADGQQYSVQADVAVAGGSVTVALQAATPGQATNCDPGTALTLVNPIAGIASSGAVDGSGLNGGADAETDADLLTRLLLRLQNGVPNGKKGDYEQWALEVPGVTRAWDFPLWLGLGTVGVFFVLDNQPGSIIPSGGTVTLVQDYIEALCPSTATLYVIAPTAVDLDPTIAVLPNTPDVQAAVQAELADLLKREAEPGSTIPLWQLRQAIGQAAGITGYTLVSPVADVVRAAGEIQTLGTVTWA